MRARRDDRTGGDSRQRARGRCHGRGLLGTRCPSDTRRPARGGIGLRGAARAFVRPIPGSGPARRRSSFRRSHRGTSCRRHGPSLRRRSARGSPRSSDRRREVCLTKVDARHRCRLERRADEPSSTQTGVVEGRVPEIAWVPRAPARVAPLRVAPVRSVKSSVAFRRSAPGRWPPFSEARVVIPPGMCSRSSPAVRRDRAAKYRRRARHRLPEAGTGLRAPLVTSAPAPASPAGRASAHQRGEDIDDGSAVALGLRGRCA